MKNIDKPNIILVLFIVLTGCINSEDYLQVKKDMSNIKYSQQTINYDSIYEIIPEYSEIIKAISETDIEFNPCVLLPIDNVEFYANSKNTAIALGMYSANLAYVRHFERVQLCIDYLNSVRILSNKLAINTSEFNRLVPKIESSLNNKEEIFLITDSLLEYGNKWFTDYEIQGLSGLFAGGFWLESLYLGIENKNIKIDNIAAMEISKKKHFELLEGIILLLAPIEDDSVISDFKSELKQLKQKNYNNKNLKDNILEIREGLIINSKAIL